MKGIQKSTGTETMPSGERAGRQGSRGGFPPQASVIRKEDSIGDPCGGRRMGLWEPLTSGFYLFKFGMGETAWPGEGSSNTELDLSLGFLPFWALGIEVPPLPWLVPCALPAFSHRTPLFFSLPTTLASLSPPYSLYYFLPQDLYMCCPSV